MNIYEENGFENRQEYLEFLSEEYDIDLYTVFSLADSLGENEDFDGLVLVLEDHGGGF